jgi:hypothetical protein
MVEALSVKVTLQVQLQVKEIMVGVVSLTIREVVEVVLVQ